MRYNNEYLSTFSCGIVTSDVGVRCSVSYSVFFCIDNSVHHQQLSIARLSCATSESYKHGDTMYLLYRKIRTWVFSICYLLTCCKIKVRSVKYSFAYECFFGVPYLLSDKQNSTTVDSLFVCLSVKGVYFEHPP